MQNYFLLRNGLQYMAGLVVFVQTAHISIIHKFFLYCTDIEKEVCTFKANN